MDTSFQVAVNQSTLLDAETKADLLSKIAIFTPAQIQKILLLLQEAEVKKNQILAQLQDEKMAFQQEHLQKIDFFFKHTFPKLLRDFEARDKAKEAPQLDSLMAQLEHL
jgi:hypothetical protein